MEKDRRRLPSHSSSSSSGGSGTPPLHGGYSSATGSFPATMSHNAMPAHYNNAQMSRHLPPPPGFSVQNNNMNMYEFHEPTHRQPQPAFQNFHSFGQDYGVNEKFGIPQNVDYSQFYAQEHNMRRSSAVDQPHQFGDMSVHDQQQYNNVGIYAFQPDLSGMNGLINGSSEYSCGVNGVYDARQAVPDEKSNNNIKLINPVIEQIVGSMSMSNGTYTHFGPAVGTQNYSSEQRLGSFVRSEVREEDPLESVGASMSSGGGSGKESPVGIIGTNSTGVSVRSATPNDGMDVGGSRPQTPGKPSYSEILAKNAAQNGVTPNAASVRKVSSASPSPISSKNSTSDSFQPISHPHHHLNHRKSVDYLNMSSNSSAASSSCASASSSPVAKQKSISQSIVGRLFNSTKGKENSTENLKNTTITKTTPSSTPTHQQKKNGQSKGHGNNTNGSQKSNDRKVLSSFENQGTGSGNKPKSSSTKTTPVSANQNNFEFEIEDLDEENEWGWKTYTSRGRNSRPNNASSNNTTAKKNSDGNFGIPNGELSSEKENGSENNNEVEVDVDSRRDSLAEKRSSCSNSQPPTASVSGSTSGSNNNVGGGPQSQRKGREKEKGKPRKDDRNCAVRKVQRIMYLWVAHLVSAAAWLLKLVTDVVQLSISVGSTLIEDFHSWWVSKAVPTCFQHLHSLKDKIGRFFWKIRRSLSWRSPFRRKSEDSNSGNGSKRNGEELLAALGPDRNIALPSNGDEALKRLLSVKGQDPYSILGIRSDSSDETIRRYYKKQAVMVHPDKNLVLGAEEAFKILARAFELIGEPLKRAEYHQKLLEAHAKEKVYGEIGKLLDQLRKKMEIATSSIRCTKCNARHKKNKTDRPLFAARFCAQCGIHHGAREGELWAERNGWFGLAWNYFACMDCHVWEINEWAKCQKKNLQHIKPDSHSVMYRLVAGNGNNQQGQQQTANGNANHAGDGHFHVDAEDDWDSLINNLCKSPGGVPGGGHFYQQGKPGGNCCPGGNAPTSNSSSSGKKRKGKRK